MKYTLAEINKIVNGRFLNAENETVITHICTDTRQISAAENSLFFCLVARSDGHQYISTAYKKGVRNFVVSKNVDFQSFNDACFILVDDTLSALQTLAKFHRMQFKIPIIGITGSNGKTIVKEWLFQLLSSEKNLVKSPKSYNSQIGVPLSIFNIENNNELGIFEAGISKVGEMEKLQEIIHPNIGILTNIGSAHDAGFSSTQEKIQEKLKLFANADVLIYREIYVDEQLLHDFNFQKIAFGEQANSAVQVHLIEKKNQHTLYQLSSSLFGLEKTNILLPFSDEASIENCLHCVVTLLYLGYSIDFIAKKILTLRNLPMRLELKYGINRCTLVDDSYSADFHSLQIAIDFLFQQEVQKKKTLIISEFEESGLSEKDFIQKLKSILQQNKFDKLIGIGEAFMHHIESLASVVKEWYVFENTTQFIEQFHILHFENEIILLKGARKFMFEKISAQLIEQTHTTVFEVNLNALTHNLNVYRGYLPKNCGVIAMVKAFSYGSGSVEVAALLEQQHVAYLAVAYADEGITLRKNNIQTPIIVMNPDAVDFDRMLEYHLEPEIYSLEILHQLIQKINGNEVAIHIKVESGMNRLGFVQSEIPELISILNKHKNVQVKTVFSHLAASEDAQFDSFTEEQISTFSTIVKQIEDGLSYPIKKHLLNSSGIIRFPQAHFDFVRLGIGLYGVDSSATIQQQLEPIGKLKTRIAQIKQVQAGDTIGYSRKGIAQNDMKIAVLAIGYADGFDRRFGNGVGKVFIAGQRAPIIGNVCMDMCMADFTHIKNVHEGDECEIYGKQISIVTQAQKIGTIPYELLTKISARVKRLYFLD
ncbi:MAG: bifunctional UDP-N-acetylmuramoyl-tripeptide:D-alanyl-D-alanine ligase/alanine racemase [Bacteroidetes bacterium]|nr:bifunctional UDP-N-acetylmuramoyl-tripeptide:D-alanyl-D-alanine ligase/alanine racemase [Bacteroidota bacterium]